MYAPSGEPCPPGDVLLDPVPGAQVIEEHRPRRLRRFLPGGRIEVVGVVLQLRGDGLEVLEGLVDAVVPGEEPERVGGARRLGGDLVHQRQAEAGGQRDHGGVAGVEELAAPFAGLAVDPVRGVGVDAAADGRRFVDGGGEARVLQGERRVEPGDAAADDGDARALPGRGAQRAAAAGQHRRRGGPLEDLAPARPAPGAPFERVLPGAAAAARGASRVNQAPERRQHP